MVSNLISADLTVTTDPYMLSSVFRNLLSNAIKFTPPGGSISFSADHTPDDLFVRIRVRDNGSGMDEATMETLFQIKERLSFNKGSDSSSGFGLVLCKDFLTRLGGDITVSSQPGEGTTFTVLLPI